MDIIGWIIADIILIVVHSWNIKAPEKGMRIISAIGLGLGLFALTCHTLSIVLR